MKAIRGRDARPRGTFRPQLKTTVPISLVRYRSAALSFPEALGSRFRSCSTHCCSSRSLSCRCRAASRVGLRWAPTNISHRRHGALKTMLTLTLRSESHCGHAAVGSGSRGSRSPRRLACFAARAHHGAQLALRVREKLPGRRVLCHVAVA